MDLPPKKLGGGEKKKKRSNNFLLAWRKGETRFLFLPPPKRKEREKEREKKGRPLPDHSLQAGGKKLLVTFAVFQWRGAGAKRGCLVAPFERQDQTPKKKTNGPKKKGKSCSTY